MTKEPKTPGRPQVRMDPEQLQKLLAMQCSDEQVAAWFGFTLRSLYNAKKREPYREIFEHYRERGKAMIKMALFDEGVNKRCPSILIWLDKTICGTRIPQHVVVTPTKPLHEMSDAELYAIAANAATGGLGADNPA